MPSAIPTIWFYFYGLDGFRWRYDYGSNLNAVIPLEEWEVLGLFSDLWIWSLWSQQFWRMNFPLLNSVTLSWIYISEADRGLSFCWIFPRGKIVVNCQCLFLETIQERYKNQFFTKLWNHPLVILCGTT